MAIFSSYVSLPEGTLLKKRCTLRTAPLPISPSLRLGRGPPRMDPAGHCRHGRAPASAARGDFRQRVASRGTSRGRRHLGRAAAKFLGMVG